MTVLTYYADTGPLHDPGLFDELYALQPGYRREKIDRFRFHRDKALSLGAGELLRRVLAEHGIRETDPEYGPEGKPSVPGISFNLSHSGERVMCSVSGSDVGCDVEQVSDIDLEIARRFFFGSEYEMIMSQDDSEGRMDMFYRFWTLKESFMKATGLGFRLPLDSFAVSLGDTISVRQDVDGREYGFREFRVEAGYRYSCCSADLDFDTEIRKVSF